MSLKPTTKLLQRSGSSYWSNTKKLKGSKGDRRRIQATIEGAGSALTMGGYRKVMADHIRGERKRMGGRKYRKLVIVRKIASMDTPRKAY